MREEIRVWKDKARESEIATILRDSRYWTDKARQSEDGVILRDCSNLRNDLRILEKYEDYPQRFLHDPELLSTLKKMNRVLVCNSWDILSKKAQKIDRHRRWYNQFFALKLIKNNLLWDKYQYDNTLREVILGEITYSEEQFVRIQSNIDDFRKEIKIADKKNQNSSVTLFLVQAGSLVSVISLLIKSCLFLYDDE